MSVGKKKFYSINCVDSQLEIMGKSNFQFNISPLDDSHPNDLLNLHPSEALLKNVFRARK